MDFQGKLVNNDLNFAQLILAATWTVEKVIDSLTLGMAGLY